MRYTFGPILAAITLGCTATPLPPATDAARLGRDDTTAAVHARSERMARRISELEARLGLLESEARQMRALLQQRDVARPDVVRIGADRTAQHDAEPVLDAVTAANDGAPSRAERRPLLRSVAEPRSAERVSSLPALGAHATSERLPVVPLPSVAQASAATQGGGDRAAMITQYRAALALVRSRDFDAAVSALTEFLATHADQEFTDRAMFWRAEAYYARREYERALAEFEAVSARFPRSEKAADALLKIGMCHQRLGDEQRAQVFFRRLQSQFPESAAARAASKEGA